MIVGVADTHAIIWHIYADVHLSVGAKNFIEGAAKNGNQIAVSSITMIELIYLIEKRRIAAETFSRLAGVLDTLRPTFVQIPVDLNIARAMTRVDVAQISDMPDRIVAATAVHLNVPIISRDGKIKLSNITTIW